MGVLRLLLAISVVASHTGSIFGTTLLPGNYAVETFFMISGFYMSLVFDSKYTGQGALWKFYSNRYLRLYPLYLLVLIATWGWFLFAWVWQSKLPANSWVESYHQMEWLPKLGLVIANWTLLGLDIPSIFHFSPSLGFLPFHYNDAQNSPDGLKWAGEFRTVGQAWSVGLEIWFYAIVPWLAKLSHSKLLAIGLISVALKTYMEQADLLTYFFFPAQLCFFLAGMGAQRCWKQYQLTLRSIPNVGLVCIVIVTLVTVFFPFINVNSARWYYYLLCLSALPLLFERTHKMSWDRKLGNLSYPIYLLHMLILSVWTAMFKNLEPAVPVLLITIFVSMLVLRWLEEPLDIWRQKRI